MVVPDELIKPIGVFMKNRSLLSAMAVSSVLAMASFGAAACEASQHQSAAQRLNAAPSAEQKSKTLSYKKSIAIFNKFLFNQT